MSDFLPRLYRSRRARVVTITPMGGPAIAGQRMLLEDRPGRVWEKINPSGRFLLPTVAEHGAQVTLEDTGATFKIYATETTAFGRELEVMLERLEDAFDPLTDPRIYRTARAVDAVLSLGAASGPVRAILEKQESVRGLDFGKARDVLVARVPAEGLPAGLAAKGAALAVTGGASYMVYGAEPLYRSGEWRLVLEHG